MQPHTSYTPTRIISGGQTGVDRAALDVALELDITTGGWCPAGRRAQDGRIPDCYPLKETESSDYKVRTLWNVRDSNATLVIYIDTLTGGSALTVKYANKLKKPHLALNIRGKGAIETARQWLSATSPKILNIAGPRDDTEGGIYLDAKRFIAALLI